MSVLIRFYTDYNFTENSEITAAWKILVLTPEHFLPDRHRNCMGSGGKLAFAEKKTDKRIPRLSQCRVGCWV